MGKIADRFAHKTHPLYPRAKAIVQAAIRLEAAIGADDDTDRFMDLADKVEDAVKSLDAENFDKLLSLVAEQVDPRRDAESLREELLALVENTCQQSYADDEDSVGSGKVSGRLIAIPVALESGARAWEMLLPQEMRDGVEAVCKTFDLVAEDSEMTFMPRILSTSEADYLGYVDVFNIMEALSLKQPDEAVRILAASQARVGFARKPRPLQKAGVEALSFGLLVAFVETDDSEPFPLLSSLEEAENDYAEDDYAQDDDEGDEAAPELLQAHQDVTTILEDAGAELANVLGCSSARILSYSLDWFIATHRAKLIERESASLIALNHLADEFTQGDVTGLVGSFDFEQPKLTDDGIAFQVHDRASGKFLRDLSWRPFAVESLDEALECLAELLESRGLLPESQEPSLPGAPLALAAPVGPRKTLH